MDYLWLLVGLALILFGANWLTDGASSIARKLGISDLIVGLTVVAFGTSAPELVISIMSAINGNSAIAIGNVVGSNIVNILLIVGITACIVPIKVEKSVLGNEIPMVILSSIVILILGNSAIINGSGVNEITRTEAILLIVFGLIFVRYTIASAKKLPDPASDPTAIETSDMKQLPVWKAIIFVIAGLAMLIFGGDKFVDGATGIARSLGISDAVIGLTIVAIGTSLPELATSIVAACKGKADLAIGNVVGSNIFNIVFVLGIAGAIHPLQFGAITNIDLGVLLLASFLFLMFGWLYKVRTITRIEGAMLVVLYIAYMLYLLQLTT